jgi:DNA-binding XRE family transcriptional regulator
VRANVRHYRVSEMRLDEGGRGSARSARSAYEPGEENESGGRHEPIDLSFAIWLSHQLRRQRLSQRELARRSGVAHSTISRILLGQRQPSWATLQHLALVLGNPPPNVLLGRFGVRLRSDALDKPFDRRR